MESTTTQLDKQLAVQIVVKLQTFMSIAVVDSSSRRISILYDDSAMFEQIELQPEESQFLRSRLTSSPAAPMPQKLQFVWPKDGPKGRSGHRGFFGRLDNILTNRGPDVFLQRKGSSTPILPETWGNWYLL
jgi:hypothetical protein